MRPHNLATGLRLPSTTVVSAEPFSHGTGTLRYLQKEMATYRHWSVSLWRDPYDVPHCRILSPGKTEWRLISATLCGWRCCFVADQLWLMTHVREEEEEECMLCYVGSSTKIPGTNIGKMDFMASTAVTRNSLPVKLQTLSWTVKTFTIYSTWRFHIPLLLNGF